MIYQQHLDAARAYLAENGAQALQNPHAMIGRTCGCHNCFTCAAAQVVHEYHVERRAKLEVAAALRRAFNRRANRRITLFPSGS
mgnify:FL=1